MICCLVADTDLKPGALADLARACSPRVEVHGDRVVVFDASGLGRVIGPPAMIAREVSALAMEQGLVVRIAMAPTMVAAWLMAHAQIGQTVVDPPRLAAMIGALPLKALSTLPASSYGARKTARANRDGTRGTNALDAFERWGLKTLAQIAKLPRADVHARLGDEGVRLHQAACGEDASPLVPAGAAPAFLERMVLEWPIEGLEPLTFVLSRLCDALSLSLERADRGAVAITTRLKLVDRTSHVRTLNLPAPMRDAKVLRTLVVLDLEANPPHTGIDEVGLEANVAPGRIVQGSLLERALPSPEAIATLTARLSALAGETRVGVPVLLDTHDDRQSSMEAFSGSQVLGFSGARVREPEHLRTRAPENPSTRAPEHPRTVLRRFRIPIPARVVVERGGPVRVVPSSPAIPAGKVVDRAGPWRTSGRWWVTASEPRERVGAPASERVGGPRGEAPGWDRDEWDVEISGVGCYRLARHRDTGNWEIEGEID